MRPRPTAVLCLVLGACGLAVLFVGAGLLLPTAEGTEVCTRCGVMRTYAAYRLPFTGVTLRRTSALRATPVSNVLAKHGVGQGEPHVFELMQEGPGSFLGGHYCALGGASNVGAVVQSPDAASFLDALLTYGDPATAHRWVGWVLSNDTANAARFAPVLAGFPNGGFVDQAAFQTWWRSAEADMDETIRQK